MRTADEVKRSGGVMGRLLAAWADNIAQRADVDPDDALQVLMEIAACAPLQFDVVDFCAIAVNACTGPRSTFFLIVTPDAANEPAQIGGNCKRDHAMLARTLRKLAAQLDARAVTDVYVQQQEGPLQ